MAERELWSCPRCGRTFANRNQTHTCAAVGGPDALDGRFVRCDPVVRQIFDALVHHVEPVDVLVEKSRIALHIRMSFAAMMPRTHWLDGHLVLARTAAHPSFRRIEVYSAHNVLHAFRLTEAPDAEFLALLAEARDVGEQRHLGRS
ncbi:hypothetical protein [Microbacterium deminutum]|uniref:DUF5655 domain-containing protein n=1 Tax=Microbacterium deminutum TaxID=344164 RepID=A0ABN2QRQ4_9MICO